MHYFRKLFTGIGNEYKVLTALLFCFPGIHLGDIFKTRIASSPVPEPISLNTLILLNEPSFSIIKVKYTFPLNVLSFGFL